MEVGGEADLPSNLAAGVCRRADDEVQRLVNKCFRLFFTSAPASRFRIVFPEMPSLKSNNIVPFSPSIHLRREKNVFPEF